MPLLLDEFDFLVEVMEKEGKEIEYQGARRILRSAVANVFMGKAAKRCFAIQ